MNREIKFRAWDSFTKTMWPWEKLQTFEGNAHLKLYFEDSDNNLMQYTGLKDKNGKEIYEGDIIAFMSNTENAWQIEFGMFKASDLDIVDGYEWEDTNKVPAFNVSDEEAENSEVIGNIHENPELIK